MPRHYGACSGLSAGFIQRSIRQFAVNHLATETTTYLLEQGSECRIILWLAERVLAANGIHLQPMVDDHLLSLELPFHLVLTGRIAEFLVLGNGDNRHTSRQLQAIGFIIVLCGAIKRRLVGRR